MPLFQINEFDNDYRSWSGVEEREFPDLTAAEAACTAESWTGYTYSVDRRHYRPAPIALGGWP
jgi:hypothetical protein